jgi:glycosyltransferase involved in cell wall biosynthesis
MSVVLTEIKTALMAGSTVDGPRNGKCDPENAFQDLVPALGDPDLEIPRSSAFLRAARTHHHPAVNHAVANPLPSQTPSAAPAAAIVPAPARTQESNAAPPRAPDLAPASAAPPMNAAATEPRALEREPAHGGVQRPAPPRLIVTAALSEAGAVNPAAAAAGAGAGASANQGWREVRVGDGPWREVRFDAPAAEIAGPSDATLATTTSSTTSTNGAQVGGAAADGGSWAGERPIERPMDGMLIVDHGARERAWRGLARRMYDQQPAFMDRGKQRWNGLVDYDHRADVVTWNKKPLPNSRLWRSTFDHSRGKPHLGQCVLVLMEKNESKIIERMLESIVQDIDAFIILDTGSSDGTEQVMWDFLVTKHRKPGAIYKTDWYDFGTNRTITVQLAHQTGDWLMLMDADYRLERENKAMPQHWRSLLPPLTNAPAWLLLKTTGDLDYARPHLVLGSVRWCYVCRTHEYLSRSVHDKSSANFRQDTFPALLIDHVGDGQSKSDKMGRDIALLLMDQLDDPKSERAAFYLANTLKQIRMSDWALRSYKQAMNLCGWNEEIYCSAKSAVELLFQKPGVSFERVLAMALHGITTNPERLELLAVFVRKVRNTKDWWPKYSHLCSSLLAFFTHNTYPSHQKLFIERPEHEFGIFQESSICAFYNPVYFELGLHMAHRIPELPAFKQQAPAVQQQNIRNKALYDARAGDLKARGVRVTAPIRKYLIEQGHRAMAQGKFLKAKDTYQHVLHTLALSDIIPDHLLEGSQSPAERKSVSDLCDNLSTVVFHKFHRITAWQNARPLSNIITEIDQDRALASYQMGQCQLRIDPDCRILSAGYFLDALKWMPGYPPALAALYELTLLKSSDLTRAILYLIRLVSLGPMATASLPLIKGLKAIQDSLVFDQSEWATLTTLPHLPGTPWLFPVSKPVTSKNRPINQTESESTAVWSNIMQPTLFIR